VFVTALARWLLVGGHGGHLGTVVRSRQHLDYRWQPLDSTGAALAAPSRFRDVAIATVEQHAGTGARPLRSAPLDPIAWDSAADRRVEHLLVALGSPRAQAATTVSKWILQGRRACGVPARGSVVLRRRVDPGVNARRARHGDKAHEA